MSFTIAGALAEVVVDPAIHPPRRGSHVPRPERTFSSIASPTCTPGGSLAAVIESVREAGTS